MRQNHASVSTAEKDRKYRDTDSWRKENLQLAKIYLAHLRLHPLPHILGLRVGKAARVAVISCSHLAAYIHERSYIHAKNYMSFVSCGVSNSINTVAPQGGHALHRRPAGDAEVCYVTRGGQKDKQASKQQLSEPDQAILSPIRPRTNTPPPPFFLFYRPPPHPLGHLYRISYTPPRPKPPSRPLRCVSGLPPASVLGTADCSASKGE